MQEQGKHYALVPWGQNTRAYEGEDDGGKAYILPDGHTVRRDATGSPHIVCDASEYPCMLIRSKSGGPAIVSMADKWSGARRVIPLQPA